MSSNLQSHIKHQAGLSTAVSMHTLNRIFTEQARGKRLRLEDFKLISAALERTATSNPLTIYLETAINDASKERAGTRSLKSTYLYLAPLAPTHLLAKQDNINPYAHVLYAVSKQMLMTARVTDITLRNLPVSFCNEALETDYIRHTGKILDYKATRIQSFVDLALLFSQGYGDVMGKVPPHAQRAVYLPLGDGLAFGQIIPVDLDTRLHRLNAGKNVIHQHPVEDHSQPLCMLQIRGYLPPSMWRPEQEAYYFKLKEDFIDPAEAASLVRQNAELYWRGDMAIPGDHPSRDKLEALRIDMRAMLEGSYWHDLFQYRQQSQPIYAPA